MNNHDFNWEDYYNKNNNFKPDYNEQSIAGINALAKYLYAAGGPAQQSRMITDKRKTLDRVISQYPNSLLYFAPKVLRKAS